MRKTSKLENKHKRTKIPNNQTRRKKKRNLLAPSKNRTLLQTDLFCKPSARVYNSFRKKRIPKAPRYVVAPM